MAAASVAAPADSTGAAAPGGAAGASSAPAGSTAAPQQSDSKAAGTALDLQRQQQQQRLQPCALANQTSVADDGGGIQPVLKRRRMPAFKPPRWSGQENENTGFKALQRQSAGARMPSQTS